MSDKSLNHVKLRNQDNYHEWLDCLEARLKAKGRLGYVNGKAKPPTPPWVEIPQGDKESLSAYQKRVRDLRQDTTAKSTSTSGELVYDPDIYDLDDVDYLDKVETFELNRTRTCGMILLTLESHVRISVKGIDDPGEMMLKLEELYGGRTLDVVPGLLMNLLHLKFDEAEGMRAYIAKLTQLEEDLTRAGYVMGKLWDQLEKAVLYANLPASYAQTIEVIRGKSAPKREHIHRLLCQREDLLHEEKKGNESNGTNPSVNNVKQGFHKQFNGKKFNKPKNGSITKRKGGFKKEPSSDAAGAQIKPRQGSPNIVCFRCGGKGHVQRDCPSPASNTEPKGKFQRDDIETIGCVTVFDCKVDTILATQTENGYDLNEWYLDSGAACHCTGRRDWLHGYTDIKSSGRYLEFANGSREEVEGTGTLIVETTIDGGQTRVLAIKDVLYSHKLGKNLLSTRKILANGGRVRMDARRYEVFDHQGRVMIQGTARNNLYAMELVVVFPNSQINTVRMESQSKGHEVAMDLHRRYGHVGRWRLTCIAKHLGIKIDATKLDCEICAKAKQTRAPIKDGPAPRSNQLAQRVHSDVCGPMQTASLGGNKYFVTFIDDYSRYAKVYLMKEKSEVLSHFKNYLLSLPDQHRCRVLHSDQGGEYMSNEFKHFLEMKGIEQELAPAHTPEFNGVAERYNRTLMEMVRCMLFDAGIGKGFWGEAVLYATQLNNRMPTRANGGQTAFELWYGRMPRYNHLHRFGCKVTLLVPSTNRKKLDPKTQEAIYMGPDKGDHQVHRVYTNKIQITRDVKFFENAQVTMKLPGQPLTHSDELEEIRFPKVRDPILTNKKHIRWQVQGNEATLSSEEDSQASCGASDMTEIDHAPRPSLLPEDYPVSPSLAYDSEGTNEFVENPDQIQEEPSQDSGASVEACSDSETEQEVPLDTPQPVHVPVQVSTGRPRRATAGIAPRSADYEWTERKYKPFTERINAISEAAQNEPTPASYKEAMELPSKAQWRKAMQIELDSLIYNGTFVLVPAPKCRKVVGTKWVFKIKRNPDGSVDRYKARWVVKGYLQIQGQDYDETFAPVVRHENLKLVLAYATILDLEIHSMDVKTAFPHAELHEEVYVEQPEGFVDDKHPEYVYRLIKCLYGLKQAPYEWNQTMDRHLRACGFIPSKADPCIYVKREDKDLAIIALFVDDCTIVATKKMLQPTKDMLANKFKMVDLGEIKSVLGMAVIRDRQAGTLILRQPGKVDNILRDYNMLNAKPRDTPMLMECQLKKVEKTATSHLKLPYREAVGRLSYLAHTTRPDITFAVNVLSRHVNGYDATHWEALKNVLRYLSATRMMAIKYSRGTSGNGRNGGLLPIGFTDSDWGGDLNTRRSTTGMVFMLAGGPISWSSRAQSCVALSTTKVELNSLSEAARQALYLRKHTESLGLNKQPIKIFNDNQSALTIVYSYDGQHHHRMKHYDIKEAHIREATANGLIIADYRQTDDMPADLLTKALGKIKFDRFRKLIGMTDSTNLRC